MRGRFGTSRYVMAAGAVVLAGLGVARPATADRLADSTSRATSPTDVREPSISADGRWVVYQGTSDDRRSVFRVDRDNDATVELSLVPKGVRSGDTIHARISADGCVVVAITEIAFDLFRDDDRDDRWDVYRLVLPECGGQPNGWELVSLSERTGTAEDGVFTDSAPTLSGSGAVLAYAHQLHGAPDGVSTISVVDVTVATTESGRVQRVAGMPAEAPNRAYMYRGFREPVLSQNGRHLAFVADATASDPLPGWADGPVQGELAASQVYVWDRFYGYERGAVHLVSGRDGQRSGAGAASPAMSEDGRIIVFTSSDRTLVTAELPACTPECPTQVYRFDRDTDGNGIFDEPPRRSPLTLVSAVDAGVVEVGVPVAGNRSSWGPAVNADGSQVAFVTDATNLLPSHRAGGGDADDGDLLVAEYHLGQVRRVLDREDLTGVPGASSRPSLSKTGQVIAFDTAAADVLAGVEMVAAAPRRAIAIVEATPLLSLAALDFGTVVLGLESAELYAQVLNAGPAAFEPTVVQTSPSNFRITGGTCKRGVIVAAGTSCSVYLTFTPTAPRGYSGTLTVSGDGEGGPQVTTTLNGAAGEPTLLADPGGVDLAPGVVGEVGGRVAIDIDNVGFIPTSVARIELGGAHPDDFQIVTEACRNRALNPDASCAIEIEFRPRGVGYRTALLVVTAAGGAYTAAVLGGFARYEPRFGVRAEDVARPGGQIGVGGSGFPANATVSIGFDDGGTPFTTVTTNEVGSFLGIITLPGRLRAGPRTLVATAAGGATGTWPIDVRAPAVRSNPVLPGFGLG